MSTLLIENLPEDVLRLLEIEAEVHHITVAEVAAEHLVRAIQSSEPPPAPMTKAQLLRLADRIRAGSSGAWLTPEFIRAARAGGPWPAG